MLTPHEKTAGDLFLSGCSCAQAVVLAFRDVTGLDDAAAAKISSSFGGGMGRMRLTCGAVTGMFMVLGLLYGYPAGETGPAKAEHYARIQETAARFRELFGSVSCAEILKDLNVSASPVPDERTEEYYKRRPCARQVMAAARILDAYIEAHPL